MVIIAPVINTILSFRERTRDAIATYENYPWRLFTTVQKLSDTLNVTEVLYSDLCCPQCQLMAVQKEVQFTYAAWAAVPKISPTAQSVLVCVKDEPKASKPY